jgi:thiosulfate/3-mercaptopyruvate sulfurtransferase
MPHALSLPFTALLSPATGPGKPYTSFLPVEQLRQVIIRALSSPHAKLDLSVQNGGLSEEELEIGRKRWEQVKQGKKLTWSCGSGMTAAVGVWAMRLVAQAESTVADGKSLDNVGLYDEVCFFLADLKNRKTVLAH